MSGMAHVIKDNVNRGLTNAIQSRDASVNDRFVRWPGRFEAENRRISLYIMTFVRS